MCVSLQHRGGITAALPRPKVAVCSYGLSCRQPWWCRAVAWSAAAAGESSREICQHRGYRGQHRRRRPSGISAAIDFSASWLVASAADEGEPERRFRRGRQSHAMSLSRSGNKPSADSPSGRDANVARGLLELSARPRRKVASARTPSLSARKLVCDPAQSPDTLSKVPRLAKPRSAWRQAAAGLDLPAPDAER